MYSRGEYIPHFTTYSQRFDSNKNEKYIGHIPCKIASSALLLFSSVFPFNSFFSPAEKSTMYLSIHSLHFLVIPC